MEIRELVQKTDVPVKTIRFYEEIKLLPPPPRKANGYRNYSETDAERVRFVSGARRLDFSLDEIRELFDLRERNIAPCGVLLEMLESRAEEIEQRIAVRKSFIISIRSSSIQGQEELIWQEPT